MEEQKLLEKILKGIVGKKENAYIRKQELNRVYNGDLTVFKDEYFIIINIVMENMRNQSVVDKEFIKMYLRINKGKIQNLRNVNIQKYALIGDDGYEEFTKSVLSIFERSEKEEIEDSEYFTTLEKYKMHYMSVGAVELLEESAQILIEGKNIGGKKLVGLQDMCKHIKAGMLKIENMENKTDRKGIITFGVNDEEEDEESSRVKLVTTFGVEELDKHISVYEGDMVSILAPAKGGKSRFVTKVLHNAVVNHGQNVVMWSIENGYKGWEYLIRARHFTHFYVDTEVDVNNKRVITDDMIRKGKLDQEMKELEQASYTDLKTNSNYGKITVIDAEFEVETFLDVLEEAVNTTGAKLVCIDYLQLLTASGRGVSKTEVIGDAYKKVLQYLKKKKIAGLFPAQLKQTVVGSLGNKEEEDLVNLELRDAAGESYEVIKTPDINLALYGTPEDIRNGSMKILSIPSRNSATFDPINMYVDMGSCSFYSL